MEKKAPGQHVRPSGGIVIVALPGKGTDRPKHTGCHGGRRWWCCGPRPARHQQYCAACGNNSEHALQRLTPRHWLSQNPAQVIEYLSHWAPAFFAADAAPASARISFTPFATSLLITPSSPTRKATAVAKIP